MVILNTIREQKLCSFFASLPPRSHATLGGLAAKLGQHLVRLIQHIALLFNGHIRRVLVTVPVQPNLMTLVSDRCAIFWKRLECVAGDEPCRFDLVLVE